MERDKLLWGNPKRDEILTYMIKEGKIIKKPNLIPVSGTDPIGALVVESAIMNKPLQWAGSKLWGGLKEGFKYFRKDNNYTNNLIKALGDKYQGSKANDVITSSNQLLKEFLEKSGVDVSKFSNSDLTRLSGLRNESLKTWNPNSRHGIIFEMKSGKNKVASIDLNNSSKKVIGDLEISTGKDKKVLVQNVQNLMPGEERHVSEDLYNAGLNYAKQNKLKGLVSGEILNSPEQTYKIWNKFNKTKIASSGIHNFNKGTYVIKTGDPYTIINGPVYKLNKSTKDIPLKSANIFHPSVVDDNGKFRILSNTDMYKLLVPATLGSLNN